VEPEPGRQKQGAAAAVSPALLGWPCRHALSIKEKH
jgi:hypothetical protein